jgi:hypothetical protein
MAYAYLVPLDPYFPEDGLHATLVRSTPVRVGDRIALSRAEAMPDGGRSVHGTDHDWEVIAIQATERDGRPAPIRGYRGSGIPIMHGLLVVRPVEPRSESDHT